MIEGRERVYEEWFATLLETCSLRWSGMRLALIFGIMNEINVPDENGAQHRKWDSQRQVAEMV